MCDTCLPKKKQHQACLLSNENDIEQDHTQLQSQTSTSDATYRAATRSSFAGIDEQLAPPYTHCSTESNQPLKVMAAPSCCRQTVTKALILLETLYTVVYVHRETTCLRYHHRRRRCVELIAVSGEKKCGY